MPGDKSIYKRASRTTMSGWEYAPLWCKSHYSFLVGASSPAELVQQAKAQGLKSIAICDQDGVYGVVRAHLACQESGLKLIVGSEIGLRGGSKVLLLAKDAQGYANLCRLISLGRRRCVKGRSEVSWDELCSHAPGNIALFLGLRHWPAAQEQCWAKGSLLHEVFGADLYAAYARHQRPQEGWMEARLRAWAQKHALKMVVAQEVLYHRQKRHELQDVITCIAHRKTIEEIGQIRRSNAQHYLMSPDQMAKIFSDVPEDLKHSLEIAEQCRFSFTELDYRYPSELADDERSAEQRLSDLCQAGGDWRYGRPLEKAEKKQLEKELRLISELRYAGYFLTMYEIVQFCNRSKILCQGRGSAANSFVCYLLGITAVDPVRMNFLFERFLSKERAEPPDIDLDIEHERREEVIAFVYERYGREHAAMVANVIRYRTRSALREVGKVLGISAVKVDKLARRIGHHFEHWNAQDAQACGLELSHPKFARFFRLVDELVGSPRHLSIHPGGFLLGEAPISSIVPIENASMPGRTVIQWDKEDIEALGLFKVDLLGLGALSLIRRCFDQIRESRARQYTLGTIPAHDESTYEMICQGDTVGVFQIESRAQMAMLPRLQPRNYYDLVIEVSIVRPGPIAGGMVHPYLRRKKGEEAVTYPHPCLKEVLERTLGVPLFQEQVMRLAVVAAGYSPGEADQLRRDMGAWKQSGRMEAHRRRLIEGMRQRGIEEEFAERVFAQIRGFGEYGFPESHAASFALLAYITAYLKCHYPVEFCTALLNAQPMGFYSPNTILQDAKRHGVRLRPIDVLHSGWECSVEEAHQENDPHGWTVRMGLSYVKGLSQQHAPKIVQLASLYEYGDDWAARSGLDSRSLELLAKSGALRSVSKHRREALWNIYQWSNSREDDLLWHAKGAWGQEKMPELEALAAHESLAWDFAASHHSTAGHPLEPLREHLELQGLPCASEIGQMGDGRLIRYVGAVICRQRPMTASGVTFLTLEDESGFVNLVVWKAVYAQFRILVKTAKLLGVKGRLQVAEGCVHLVAQELWDPRPELQGLKQGGGVQELRSRDFQ